MHWLMMTVIKSLNIIRGATDVVTNVIFGLIYKEPTTKLPPINNPILLANATSLAAKIRKQELKSEDVVKAYIDRIKEVNPILNAVVDERFEKALEEAKEVDALIASGKKTEEQMEKETPFLGVPFTSKENFEVIGLHQTVGLVARREYIGKVDASAVSLIKKSGAILLGVTNLSEMCTWWESSNHVYGRTNNPYHTSRIVGGSSGGEGCILSAAGSVIGLGSDIGGSIRMPAFFNGIFGHKPTQGIVCNDGQLPHAYDELNKYLVSGPMCRYAGDLQPLLKVLTDNKVDKLKLDTAVDMKSIRLFYMENDGGFPLISNVDPEIVRAQHKILEYFEKEHGIKAKKVVLPKMVHSIEIWANIMTGSGAPTMSELLSENTTPLNPPWELCKWFVGQSNHMLPAIILCLGECLGLAADKDEFKHAITLCKTLQKELEELLGDDGVFLYPSHPTPAPYHNQPVLMSLNFAYAAIFNVTGLPVTQCPLGLGSKGLPLGIQVVSGLFQDHLTMAVACEIEKAFGGWVCPSEIADNKA